MAPAKRARPAFSPPRPGKSNPTSKPPVSNTSKARHSTGRVKPVSKSKTRAAPPKRSRYTSATESESDSQGVDDTDEGNKPADDHDEDMQDDNDQSSSETGNEPNVDSSPEPEYILAEVTRADDSSSSTTGVPPIPPPLIHRILHSHFAQPEKTKLSKDARDVVSKYIEVFVREAIMRCAYEKSSSSNNNDKNGAERDGMVSDDGWLEVEDLEKAAVQLCLDF